MNRYLISNSLRIRFFVDILFLVLSFTAAHYVRYGQFPTLIERDPYSLFFLFLVFLWFTLTFIFPVYHEQRVLSISNSVTEFVKYVAIYVSLISLSIVIARWTFVSRKTLIFFIFFFLLSGIIFRVIYKLYVYYVRSKGDNIKNLLILGVGAVASVIEKRVITRPEMGYKITGYLKEDGEEPLVRKYHKIEGNVSDLEMVLKSRSIDEVAIAISGQNRQMILEAISTCDKMGVRSWIVPDFFAMTSKGAVLDSFDGIPILKVRAEPLQSLFNRFIKRSFDISISIFTLITIMPFLMAGIWISNLVYSRGPLFFRQPRNGMNGNVFLCYKFRSMHINLSDKNTNDFKQATKNDPRISKIGAFLRKTNLDEFPQVINVLLGQMSIVGPRPHPIELNNQWVEEISKYTVRHFVKPGLTGWAQVNGYRGETETKRKMVKRIQYDIWYIENWTFGLDLKIIVLTAYRMVRGDKTAY
ncbi:MAG: undecaprenyl-phosphate glucose phosphotransferase [Bacteroidetes bacterium]|nr:undecaprenyl-phosphate glucose phosphotransferase [Bacteroidota bacterium]